MIVILLSICGVGLFIVGLSVAFRGYLTIPNAASIVPRVDFDNLKKNLDVVKASEMKAQNEKNAIMAELQAMRGNLESMRNAEEALRKEQDRIKKETEDISNKNEQQLAEVLVSFENLKTKDESQKAKVSELENEITFLKGKLDDQAKGSLEIIENLKKEMLTTKIDPQPFETQIKFLQEELTQKSEQAQGELSEALKLIEDLKFENDSLKESLDNSLRTLKEAEEEPIADKVATPLLEENISTDEIEQLKALNDELVEKEKVAQYELAKSRAQAAGLEQICADFKLKFEGIEQLEDELRETKRQLEVIREENNRLKQNQGKAT